MAGGVVLLHINSIKVRLKRNDCSTSRRNNTNFNSIKVRLKRENKTGTRRLRPFQFHKGTIKTGPSQLRLHRNSKFQFHKGTIKTIVIDCIFAFTSFQFHKGTIKTLYIRKIRRFCLHFNSIKVRLKQTYNFDT